MSKPKPTKRKPKTKVVVAIEAHIVKLEALDAGSPDAVRESIALCKKALRHIRASTPNTLIGVQRALGETQARLYSMRQAFVTPNEETAWLKRAVARLHTENIELQHEAALARAEAARIKTGLVGLMNNYAEGT